ncbi:DUF1515 family protein [Ensifer aridi]|uniref:DUF1515 family protein n=1 Tax=Ensifer aridi TaxID=1708715 RepID=UPI003B8A78AE
MRATLIDLAKAIPAQRGNELFSPICRPRCIAVWDEFVGRVGTLEASTAAVQEDITEMS